MNDLLLDLKDKIELLLQKTSKIESNIARLDDKIDDQNRLLRSHLVQVKRGQPLRDSTILNGLVYEEISAREAYIRWQHDNGEILLVDVTSSEHSSLIIKDSHFCHLPFNKIEQGPLNISSHYTTLFIISADGIESILACQYIAKFCSQQITHIAGGYSYWLKESIKEEGV